MEGTGSWQQEGGTAKARQAQDRRQKADLGLRASDRAA